jgi:hypothetical protein
MFGLGGEDKRRNFKIIDVVNKDGCASKFNADGRYKADKSGSPAAAAKKAFTELCRVKNVRGRCVFYVTIQETTQGSANKQFTYKLMRNKLDKPLVIGEGDAKRVIEYASVIKAMTPEDVKKECKTGKKKSSGKMRRTTAKKMTKKNNRK